MTTQIQVKHGISRGVNTYGYNLLSLYADGKKQTSTCGGGYDMLGTVFGEYISQQYRNRLTDLVPNYGSLDNTQGFYGLVILDKDNKRVHKYIEGCHVYIDGGCGYGCVERIAKAIGLTIERLGHLDTNTTSAYLITDSK